jgi:hypothetical protein
MTGKYFPIKKSCNEWTDFTPMDECQAYISNQKIMPKKMDRFDPNGSMAAFFFSFSVPYF